MVALKFASTLGKHFSRGPGCTGISGKAFRLLSLILLNHASFWANSLDILWRSFCGFLGVSWSPRGLLVVLVVIVPVN